MRELSRSRKWLFSLITLFLSLLIVEGALRIAYFNRVSDDALALGKVFRKIRALVSNQPDAQSDGRNYRDLIALPPEILAELTAQRAIIENAGNPTRAARHETILVKPDQAIQYTLRENAKIVCYTLRSTLAPNWDPPVLYLPRGARFSARTEAWIASNSVLRYEYTIDEAGHRRTVPEIRSARRMLVVGDSVGFGIGVDDAATAASYLQGILGEKYRVVNACVGGYDGFQIFQTAEKLSKEEPFDALIYIACQNDFTQDPSRNSTEVAAEVIGKFAPLRERFGGNVVVIFQTHMEYTLREHLNLWPPESIRETDALSRAVAKASEIARFKYLDWDRLVQNQITESGTVFGRFGLYVDHVHLSPAGNKLMAEGLARALF